MQKDWNLSEDVELSIWCSWSQPGIGITTMLVEPAYMVKIELLCFGIALTYWNFRSKKS